MLVFGKRDAQGRHVSRCGKYFIQRTDNGVGDRWIACEFEGEGKFKVLGRDLDIDEARWVCEDDKCRQPCGCVLTTRPDWWKFCPKCGAALPEPKPVAPTEPKKERKKKAPNRPAWLVQHTRGYEHGEEWDCVYDGKNWGLVRVPGYTGWVSVGATAYHPTSYEVVRKNGDRGMHIGLGETSGLTSLLNIPRFAKKPSEFSAADVHEGRASLATIERLKGMVDELDGKGL